MDTFECVDDALGKLSFLIAFYFTNNRGNRAIALNNFGRCPQR